MFVCTSPRFTPVEDAQADWTFNVFSFFSLEEKHLYSHFHLHATTQVLKISIHIMSTHTCVSMYAYVYNHLLIYINQGLPCSHSRFLGIQKCIHKHIDLYKHPYLYIYANEYTHFQHSLISMFAYTSLHYTHTC